MGKKQNFVDELLAPSAGLKACVIGNIEEIAMPTTKDEAVIAIAKCAVNANNALLKKMEGLDITELVLHSGERNSSLVSALLSRLEVIADSGGRLKILSPTDGATVEPDSAFVCSGEGIEQVLVTIENWGEIELTAAEGNTWSGTLTDSIAAGNYAATFSATFGDNSTDSKSVSFAIAEADIIISSIPSADTSYMPEDLASVSVDIKEDVEVSNVTMSAFGQSFALSREAGNTFTKNILDLQSSLAGLVGAHGALIDVTKADGTHVTKSVTFELFLGDNPGEG